MRNLTRRYVGGVFSVLMCLSLTAYGEKGGDAASSTPSALTSTDFALPPIEQALVPEGVFAVRLAKALQISQSDDESQAEKQLGELGIEPENGWIAEYPVTPEIIGEIDKALATAADTGKLKLEKEQALKILADVKTELGLNISAAPVSPLVPPGEPKVNKVYKYIDKQGGVHLTNAYASIPEEYRDQVTIKEYIIQIPSSPGIIEVTDALAQEYAANPDQEIINNYYDTSGPPAVTYYPPPGPYFYLYTWRPYPFWHSGFFFRGFFTLRDFHKHIWIDNKAFFVSSHFDRNDAWRGQISGNADDAMLTMSARQRLTSPGNSYSPQIRNDAREILNLDRKRRSTPPVSPGPRRAFSTSLGVSRVKQKSSDPITIKEYTFTPSTRYSTTLQVMPSGNVPSSQRK
jgi:hypothetical protein